jgi:phage I-like protein
MSGVEWIRLVSFGRYDHRKGLQVVDRDSVDTMIDFFNSLRGKLMRKFLGLPVYVGHPDDPDYGPTQNAPIYGRVENLKIEDDALWVLVRWTALGRKLFDGKFFRHLSPRWMMREMGENLFKPVRLISIGMTNHPNLCCGHDSLIDEIVKCAQRVENKENAHKVFAKNDSENKILDNSLRNTISDAALCVDHSGNKEDANKVLCENECNLPADQTSNNSNPCVAGGGELHVNSVTKNLSERADEQPVKDKILTLVYGRMSDFCENYQIAWNAVKHQHPRLFMKKF